MGGGGGSSRGSGRTLASNLHKLGKEFPRSSAGYFGSPGTSRSGRVRHLASTDPNGTARRFFAVAGKGGVVTKHKNGDVTVSSFGGGLRIVFRPRSGSDGSPVVEIYSGSLPGKHPAYQKIHFTKGTP